MASFLLHPRIAGTSAAPSAGSAAPGNSAPGNSATGGAGPTPLAVQGLLFDMGDVLYDATAWRRWLVALVNRHGLAIGYDEFCGRWDREYLGDVHCQRRAYAEAFREFLQSLPLAAGLWREIEAASLAQKRHLEQSIRPLPGVRDTLAQLRRQPLRLGVLSDSESPASALVQRLQDLGLGTFDAVVSSADLRAAKPAAEAYLAALAALRLPAEQVAFVGHDEDELVGAAAVGLPTIAFNFRGLVPAQRHLHRFEQLLSVVASRGSQANRSAA